MNKEQLELELIKKTPTLWQLTEVALNDLIEISKTPGFKINLDMYYETMLIQGEVSCYVCLAGSVMANSLDFRSSYAGSASSMSIFYDNEKRHLFLRETTNRFRALDCIRSGDLVEAYSWFYHGCHQIQDWNCDLVKDKSISLEDYLKQVIDYCKSIGI